MLLLFATYQPLRFSIEDPERQSRYASVFSVVAGAFVPLNFIAVRLAQQYVHPRVLTLGGGNLPGPMRLTFLVSLVGITLLFATLWKYEMTTKNTRIQVRRLRRTLLGEDATRPIGPERGAVMSLVLAVAPAIPLGQGWQVRGRRLHRVRRSDPDLRGRSWPCARSGSSAS